MTLNFSTHWPDKMGDMAGQPTYFIEQIWSGLKDHDLSTRAEELFYSDNGKKFRAITDFPPKIHTIRRGNRWRKGMKIHMTIHNRTKERFQFAPVLECTGVQDIEINYTPFGKKGNFLKQIYVNGDPLDQQQESEMAINDGFPNIDSFYRFFNSDFKGQIVHWTDVRC